MKKLMVAMAIAVAAICGQAGQVNWAAANLYDGSDKVAAGSYIGMLCLYNATSGISSADLSAYLASDTFTTAEKIAKITEASITGMTKTSNATGGFSGGSAVDYATGTYTAYAIFMDTSALASASDTSRYFISSDVANIAVPASGTKTVAIGNQAGATQNNPGAWTQLQAVPEPTSGLLLLLGMAGLALRRRRA